MTRIYLTILGTTLALLACTKHPTAPVVDPVVADSAIVSTPIEVPAAKPKIPTTLTAKIPPVYFGVNAYKLTEGQLIQVKRIAKKIKGETVTISGYADTTGKASYNQALSHRRAVAVLEALVALGIPRDHLTAVGLGELSGPLSKSRKTVITINP